MSLKEALWQPGVKSYVKKSLSPWGHNGRMAFLFNILSFFEELVRTFVIHFPDIFVSVKRRGYLRPIFLAVLNSDCEYYQSL